MKQQYDVPPDKPNYYPAILLVCFLLLVGFIVFEMGVHIRVGPIGRP